MWAEQSVKSSGNYLVLNMKSSLWKGLIARKLTYYSIICIEELCVFMWEYRDMEYYKLLKDVSNPNYIYTYKHIIYMKC